MYGWVRLHRKLMMDSIFHNEKLLKVFVWCLLKATHAERIQTVGRQEVKLSPGQFITGRNKASVELNMAPSTAWDYIMWLKRNNTIEVNSNNKYSIVTIMNWGLYQLDEENSDSKWTANPTANGQQMDTNKNDKNVKNDKEKESIKSVSKKPTPPAQSIFEHWNGKKILQHRKITDKLKRSINGALKDYSQEEICTAIDNYATILTDDKYYWTYKWGLHEFLQRGLDKFLNFEIASKNYANDKNSITEPKSWDTLRKLHEKYAREETEGG